MEREDLEHVQEKVSKFIPVIVIAIAALILIFNLIHIVPPGHRGVSVTLGKVSPNYRGEGLTIKKPFVEKLVNIPIKQITQEGDASSFSKDLQTIEVKFAILYRIPETSVVQLYQQYAGAPYESLISPRMQEVVKQVTSRYRAEDIVTKRQDVKTYVLSQMKETLKELINIVDVTITNIDLTDELERAIELKTIREQEALAKQFELQKEKKQAEITVVQAKAEAQAVKIKGQALRMSPNVIELEMVKKWDGKTPQSVVVSKGGANILLPIK
jgi:prohibitin 2